MLYVCGWLRSRAEVEDDEDSDDSDDEGAVAGLAGGASPVVEAGVLRGSGSDGRVRATGSGGGGGGGSRREGALRFS